jgi:hypothetical protein
LKPRLGRHERHLRRNGPAAKRRNDLLDAAHPGHGDQLGDPAALTARGSGARRRGTLLAGGTEQRPRLR